MAQEAFSQGLEIVVTNVIAPKGRRRWLAYYFAGILKTHVDLRFDGISKA